MPSRLAASESVLFVLDGEQLIALAAPTGKTRWVRSRQELGFAGTWKPGALAPTPDGGVLISNVAARTSVRVDAAGKVSQHFGLWAPIYSACVMEDQGVLALTMAQKRPVFILDRTGHVLGRSDIPWASMRELLFDSFEGAMARTRHGCVLALVAADSFAVWRDSAFLVTAAYIEEAGSQRAPNQSTALSVAANDNRIFVAFGGTSPMRAHIVDVYDEDRGKYHGSYKSPVALVELAANREFLFTISQSRGSRVVQAFHIPPVAGK
jgi:hypothetical protein